MVVREREGERMDGSERERERGERMDGSQAYTKERERDRERERERNG
jgi:hypothetical protein